MKEIRDLVAKGLYLDNLRKLIGICDRTTPPDLLVCGILSLVFHGLASEFDDQAIPAADLQRIESLLQQPILDLIDARGSRSDTVLKRIVALLRAFRKL